MDLEVDGAGANQDQLVGPLHRKHLGDLKVREVMRMRTGHGAREVYLEEAFELFRGVAR
jgi:hypothetical protein